MKLQEKEILYSTQQNTVKCADLVTSSGREHRDIIAFYFITIFQSDKVFKYVSST